jgi:DNA-binding SARP family transcriptional activator
VPPPEHEAAGGWPPRPLPEPWPAPPGFGLGPWLGGLGLGLELGVLPGAGGWMGRGLRIGVLGPMLIVQADAEIRALAAGQRAVLGLLALSHGSPVRRESIIDVLWGDEPPASAPAIVQTYVSRLRSVLDPVRSGGRVHLPASDGAGYRLQATADELDLLEFRCLVDSARQARAAGAADRACRAYERALDLWRGDPLADVDALRGHPAVVALADELAAAVLEYADFAASVTDGWHDRVLPHLRALAVRDPLHEASHARLMTALAGAGRQAEALREYHELRRRLEEQLGVLPGPAVHAAYANGPTCTSSSAMMTPSAYGA